MSHVLTVALAPSLLHISRHQHKHTRFRNTSCIGNIDNRNQLFPLMHTKKYIQHCIELSSAQFQMVQLLFKRKSQQKIKIDVQSASLIKQVYIAYQVFHSMTGARLSNLRKSSGKGQFHDPRSHLLRQDRLIVQTIKKSIPSPKFV